MFERKHIASKILFFTSLFLVCVNSAWSIERPTAIVLGEKLYLPAIFEKDLNKCSPDDVICHSLYGGDWLRGKLINKLIQPYLKKDGVHVTEADQQGLAEIWARQGEVDDVAALLDSPKSTADLNRVVMEWKINQYLYKKFSGRVFRGWGNVQEPIDAMMAFLKQEEQEKHFEITDPRLKNTFYKLDSSEVQISKQYIDLNTPWWISLKKHELARLFGYVIYNSFYPAYYQGTSYQKQGGFLRFYMVYLLKQHFAKEQNLNATSVEIEQLMKVFENSMLATSESTTKVAAALQEPLFKKYCENLIRDWKVNRYLYQQYGGVIAFGHEDYIPEPIGAIKEALIDAKKNGKFSIANAADEEDFWDKIDNEKMERSVPKDYFDAPWWLKPTEMRPRQMVELFKKQQNQINQEKQALAE